MSLLSPHAVKEKIIPLLVSSTESSEPRVFLLLTLSISGVPVALMLSACLHNIIKAVIADW